MTRHRLGTVLVLLLVPLLVAGGFLWGTARADSGLRGVQAAIVNNDEMVTVSGQAMPLGRQLAAELVDSDREQNFSWVIATQEKAAQGLASGRYAAVVTIPEEFSAAATSFSKPPGEAVRATIHVATSPVAGISETALGQTIADAASSALNRFLTGEYLKNIYLGFNQMAEQMLELVDGTRRLADGASQLADGAGLSADGASQLADGLGLAAGGSPQLRGGAAQSASGAEALADGLDLASAASAQLRDGVRQSADGAGQFATGVDTLADGTRTWADGADQFAAGVDTYAIGTATYADGVTQYTGAVNSLLTPVRAALDLVPEWGGWLADAEASVSDLTERTVAWDARVQRAIAQLRAFVTNAGAVSARAGRVSGGVQRVTAQAAALASGGALECPAELDADACVSFRQGVAAAGSALRASAGELATDADALASDSDALERAAPTVLAVLDQLSAASREMVAWAPRVQAELEGLQAAIGEGTPRTKADVLALLDEFIAGGSQLSEGGTQLADGAVALADGARQLSDGARGLADGTDQVATGMAALADGLDQLGAGVDAYTGGVDQAASGSRLLADGLGQLSSGVDAYTGGIDQAGIGAQQLSVGLGQLADGATELADGTGQLAEGVADGAGEIPTYTEAERDRLAEVAASPVETEELSGLVRPDLAWVSLLLVTALWVGSLAAFAAFGGTSRRDALSRAGSGQLLARALAPGLAVVCAQAVLLASIGAAALGLTPAEGALLVGVLVVAGLAFGLVNHALAALFGLGGRVVSLAMALVTAVAATTATAPALFGALRGLSPLTPALEGVRAVVTTSEVAIPLFVLVGWGLVGAAAAMVAIGRSRTVSLAEVARS
ncbi:MAG: YhgE/Pip family protein [Actinomycetes bacterium]